MNTLGNYFKDFREQRKLTMEDIARLAGVDRTTIWNIENSKAVRPATFRTVLTKGLGLKESSKPYADMLALWIVHRGLSDEPQPEVAKSLARLSKAKNQRIAKDANALALALNELKLKDCRALVAAMKNPDASAALVALAHHYTD